MAINSLNKLTLLFRDRDMNKTYASTTIKDELFAFRCLCGIVILLQLIMIFVDLNRITFASTIVLFRGIDLLFFCAMAFLTYVIELKRIALYQTVICISFLFHLATLIGIDYNSQINSFFLANAYITSIYLVVIVGGLRFMNLFLFINASTLFLGYYIYSISPNSEHLQTQIVNILINLLAAYIIGYIVERTKIISFQTKELLKNKASETQLLNQTKDELLNVVAIDLKAPVIQIEKTINRLKHEVLMPNNLKPQIHQISTDLSNISNLLLSLSQWSEVQLKNVKIEKSTFNINELFYDIKPLFDESINDNNITVVLPEKGKTHFVNVDKEMTIVVIRNLFANAVKFASHYGVVRISTTSNESFTTIAINNDGPGIANEQLKNIFALNTNTVRDALNRGRSGLSLVVCKTFVELNDGKIWVDSIQGDGTTFYIQFKRAF